MVLYKCQKCGFAFNKKSSLDKHMTRKTSCVKQYGSKVNKKIYNPKCRACKKSFSRKDSLKRHMKVCKNIINKENNIKNKGEINGVVINGDNNNNNKIKNKINNYKIYNNKPIILISFGKDGTSGLNFDDFIKIIKSDKNLYEALITEINFNPDKPEHHNVYYPDMKASYGKVYENKKWVDKKINEIINKLLESKTEDINVILDKLSGNLSKKIKNNIIETMADVNFSNPDRRKKLISYIKPILYNNKDMVIKTKKKIEEDSSDELADEEIFKKGTKLKDIKRIYEEKINGKL